MGPHSAALGLSRESIQDLLRDLSTSLARHWHRSCNAFLEFSSGQDDVAKVSVAGIRTTAGSFPEAAVDVAKRTKRRELPPVSGSDCFYATVVPYFLPAADAEMVRTTASLAKERKIYSVSAMSDLKDTETNVALCLLALTGAAVALLSVPSEAFSASLSVLRSLSPRISRFISKGAWFLRVLRSSVRFPVFVPRG